MTMTCLPSFRLRRLIFAVKSDDQLGWFEDPVHELVARDYCHHDFSTHHISKACTKPQATTSIRLHKILERGDACHQLCGVCRLWHDWLCGTYFGARSSVGVNLKDLDLRRGAARVGSRQSAQVLRLPFALSDDDWNILAKVP